MEAMEAGRPGGRGNWEAGRLGGHGGQEAVEAVEARRLGGHGGQEAVEAGRPAFGGRLASSRSEQRG
jgi:hypothetical protein